MTSKEALGDLRNNLFAYNLDGIPNLFENLDIIEKDLEILEIIKSGLYDAEIINNWLCGVISSKLNKEQKIIVKEWLEHETK